MPRNPQAKTQATRQLYVDRILSKQLSDGSWSLSGEGPGDVDVTAMALQALSRYTDQAAVKLGVDRALVWLSGQQQGDVPVDGSAVSQQAHQPELPGR